MADETATSGSENGTPPSPPPEGEPVPGSGSDETGDEVDLADVEVPEPDVLHEQVDEVLDRYEHRRTGGPSR